MMSDSINRPFAYCQHQTHLAERGELGAFLYLIRLSHTSSGWVIAPHVVGDSQAACADIGEREEEDPVNFIQPSLSGLTEQMWNYTALQSPCFVNNEIYTANNMSEGPNLTTMRHIRKATAPDYPSITAPRQCVYQCENILANAFTVFIHSELFHGEYTYGIRAQGLEGGDEFFPECKGNDWISGFWETGNATPESVKHRFLDFTNTFTNELRMGLMPADDGVPVLVTVEAYQLVSFTSIEKQWLVFPIFMVALEVFLLGWVIARGWWLMDGEAVWKSSILPLLYYTDRFRGTAGDDGAAWQRLMTTRKKEDAAEDVKVQFSRRGWRQQDDFSLEQMLPRQRSS